jgi:putative DNA primase/helicase
MLSILQALVGEENCSAVAMDALEDQFQRASLVDKLLNVSTEVEGKAFASGWFKAVVSGDLISASFKHATPFEFAPFCKLAFAANKFPRVLDNSDGFFRRILPIRFKRQFPDDKADRRLREKLKAELSGIFWWSLGGLVRLQQMDGFTRSGDTDDVLHEYRQANNPVLCFVEECCHTEPGYEGQTLRVSRGEIYKAYREFCTKNGFVPFNRVHFGRELRTIVPKLRDIQIRQGDNRERFFEGIGLLSSL